MRRRRLRRERGASLVELALILPLLAILAFGTIDLVRAYRLNIRLENAAREGAAYGQLRPNDIDCGTDATRGDGNDILGRIALEDEDLSSHIGYVVRVYGGSAAPLPLLFDLDASPTPPAACETEGGSAPLDGGDRLRVEVGATFDVITPLVGMLVGDTIDMTSVAEVEVQPR